MRDIAAEAARSSASPTVERQQRRGVVLVAALLLLAHGALAVGSMWEASTTFDEVSHLPAGLAIAATGDVRLNREHPPLVKELAGLAASLLHPRLPLDGPAYARADQWQFGSEVMFETGNDPMALLRAGRLPVVALSLVAAAVCFLWARQRFGDAAGLTALALYASSPLVLAHATLVTTDAGATCGTVATMWLWWRATRGRRDGMLPFALCGLALGAALAMKFSAVLLLPMMLACDLLANGPRLGRHRLLGWAVALAASAVVLQASYLSLDAPLRYLRDAQLVYFNSAPGYRYYLAGSFGARFPQYFVVGMLVKSTPVELLAMAGGLAVAVARCRERWRDDVYLWLPGLGWIAAMSALAAPIGVRYLLPAYALLFVLAGALMPELLGLAARRQALRRAAPALAGALLLANGVEALFAFPGYISYFNRFAGGAQGGVRWLDDSNLDWGQSLYRLPQWLAARGIHHARVAPMGFATPPMQGFGVTLEPMRSEDWQYPRPGAYAVSAHKLVRALEAAEHGAPTDWLRRYRPADTLDGSMYLYVFPASAR